MNPALKLNVFGGPVFFLHGQHIDDLWYIISLLDNYSLQYKCMFSKLLIIYNRYFIFTLDKNKCLLFASLVKLFRDFSWGLVDLSNLISLP